MHARILLFSILSPKVDAASIKSTEVKFFLFTTVVRIKDRVAIRDQKLEFLLADFFVLCIDPFLIKDRDVVREQKRYFFWWNFHKFHRRHDEEKVLHHSRLPAGRKNESLLSSVNGSRFGTNVSASEAQKIFFFKVQDVAVWSGRHPLDHLGQAVALRVSPSISRCATLDEK